MIVVNRADIIDCKVSTGYAPRSELYWINIEEGDLRQTYDQRKCKMVLDMCLGERHCVKFQLPETVKGVMDASETDLFGRKCRVAASVYACIDQAGSLVVISDTKTVAFDHDGLKMSPTCHEF
jgi:hypothetical protein